MIGRFARFNFVGVIGFGLQVGVLTLLVRAGLPVWLATLVAVEAALLHNFLWHERWTWRRNGGLARFHLTSGLVSMAGNTVLTPLLASSGVPIALANLAAVLACSLTNFVSAQHFVFGAGGACGGGSHAGTAETQRPLRDGNPLQRSAEGRPGRVRALRNLCPPRSLR